MVSPARIVIAGGSGALGRALAASLLADGLEVVVLTRGDADDGGPGRARSVRWDGRTVGEWAAELNSGVPTALVNLAGRLVDARPTGANIDDLRASRVDSTRALVAATRHAAPLTHWVQASTTAIYSDAGEKHLDESSPLPVGLPQMTGVARPWEDAVAGANTDHLTILRTSIVLERGFPAYDRLMFLVRLGLGGTVGSGRQWFSWIHLVDWLRITRSAVGLGMDAGLTPDLTLPPGVLIAAAPHPVRNAELMAELRRSTGRRVGLPTPAPLLRLGAVALRTDPALALTGRHCTSAVLEASGYEFRYPRLSDALADIAR